MTKGVFFLVGTAIAVAGSFLYKKYFSSYRKRATAPAKEQNQDVEEDDKSDLPPNLLIDEEDTEE